MENVVYILGAGFSAPVGIPVVSTFLEKAHDLRDAEPEKYAYFDKVFDRIRELAWAKNYYEANVENGEEALSMLEMAEYAGASAEKTEFARFICDVIKGYTPLILPVPDNGSGLAEWVFGGGRIGRDYGLFVTGLCGLKVQTRTESDPAAQYHDRAANYAVISLNYDRVLESCVERMVERLHLRLSDGFEVYPNDGTQPRQGRCVLAKLHGSVEGGPDAIVPPTWNKGRHSGILTAWKKAYEVLAQANRIRIIGYSLPENDAYFRYLLKSAAAQSRNLKQIDVLCMDDDEHTIEKRYRHFVNGRKLDFRGLTTEGYLGHVVQSMVQRNASDPLVVNIENAHRQYFGHR